MGDDFPQQRREAEDVLRRVLAAPMSDDADGMQAMNLEAARARALAQFDCWAPRWLQAAFAEVDRLGRWAELRAAQVQAVLDRHRPYETGQGAPDQELWLQHHPPALICVECGVPFPCPTRKDVLSANP